MFPRTRVDFVSDCHSIVHIYDATSGRIWGQCDLRDYLSFPTSVCVNDRHELYVSDNESHFVRVFDYTGKHLKNIGAGISYPIACRIVSIHEYLSDRKILV